MFKEFLTAVKELYHSSDEKGGEDQEEGARLAVAGGADRGVLYFLNFFSPFLLKQIACERRKGQVSCCCGWPIEFIYIYL